MSCTASPYYMYYYNQAKMDHQLKLWTVEEEKKKCIEAMRDMPKGASLKKYVQQLNMLNKYLVSMRTKIIPAPPHGLYCMECEVLYDRDADCATKYGFCSSKCANTFNGELANQMEETLD